MDRRTTCPARERTGACQPVENMQFRWTLRSLELALVRVMATPAAILMPRIGLIESVQGLCLLQGDTTGRRGGRCAVARRALKQVPHVVRYPSSAHPDHHCHSMRPPTTGRRAVTSERRVEACPEGPGRDQDYRLLSGGTRRGYVGAEEPPGAPPGPTPPWAVAAWGFLLFVVWKLNNERVTRSEMKTPVLDPTRSGLAPRR